MSWPCGGEWAADMAQLERAGARAQALGYDVGHCMPMSESLFSLESAPDNTTDLQLRLFEIRRQVSRARSMPCDAGLIQTAIRTVTTSCVSTSRSRSAGQSLRPAESGPATDQTGAAGDRGEGRDQCVSVGAEPGTHHRAADPGKPRAHQHQHHAHASEVSDERGHLRGLTNAFINPMTGGFGILSRYALPLLAVLGLIYLTLRLAEVVIRGGALNDLLATVVWTLVKLGVFYWIIVIFRDLALAALNTFVHLGVARAMGNLG